MSTRKTPDWGVVARGGDGRISMEERARQVMDELYDERMTSQRKRAEQVMAELLKLEDLPEERPQDEPAQSDRLEQVNALDHHIDRMEVAVEVLERYIEEPGMPGVVIEATTLLREQIDAAREVGS